MKKSSTFVYALFAFFLCTQTIAGVPNTYIHDSEKVVLFTNEEFEFTILDENQKELFTTIEYNSIKERLSFETKANIMLIQIYNKEGVLEFQLPVGSDVVHISKKLFSSGAYTLHFLFEGEHDFQSTELTVN